MQTIIKTLIIGLLLTGTFINTAYASACPNLYKKAELNLPFNPAFLHVDRYSDGKGLTISSFANRDIRIPGGYFERDLAARIPRVGQHFGASFDAENDLEFLTDLDFDGSAPARTVWPNSVERVPPGIVPFRALIVPQGFLTTPIAGRLTMLNLDAPNKTEYLIHQSGLNGELPAFYHNAVYHDMDNDGLKDIITVRSTFNVIPPAQPPFGALVWFKNPGANLNANTPWQETMLFGGIPVGFQGPDIHIRSHDFEQDGVPEFITTHFLTGGGGAPGERPTSGKISIYGAPQGMDWRSVNANDFMLPRSKDISTDQGFPFDIQIIDLNKDGRSDVLATNHQPDNCTPASSSEVPGRVYALESPASGDIFNDDWTTHILLNNIRPQPSLDGFRPPGRSAPGKATAFYERRIDKHAANKKPSIVVGGDEAAKVWLLQPKSRHKNNWEYKASVIFDINEYYGPNTTQTVTEQGVTVSSIGAAAVGYDFPDRFGSASIYIPVFEARDIHVLSFAKVGDKIRCAANTTLACPAP